MAHIKSIRFDSVGIKEGCVCDRCGQYIQNVWTVEFQEGITMHYGIDCWQKVKKSGNLNDYGKKMLNKIMKSIQNYYERLAKYTSGEMTEETDESYKTQQMECFSNNYWHGRPYSEYKQWMVEEFFPYRIGEEQKELEKFKKINFEA